MNPEYLLQHEFDDEPTYIVKASNPDEEFISFAPGNLETARDVLAFLNGVA